MNDSRSLRERAVYLLAQTRAESQPPEVGDLLGLVHELHVHQVELEMQNEELLRTRSELEDSRGYFERLFESAPVGYCELNPNLKITGLNQAAARLLGQEQQALVGQNFAPFVEPDWRSRLVRLLKKTTDTQESSSGELTHGPTVQLQARRFTDSGGRQRLLLALTDITELQQQKRVQQALAESRQRLSLLVDQSPMGVIEWDLEGRVTSCNRAAHNLFGYTAQEMIGLPFQALVPDPQVHTVEDVWKAQLAGTGGHHSINHNRTRDGRTILCEWHNAPLLTPLGRLIGLASMCADITQAHEAQIRFQVLFESMQDGYCSFSPEGQPLLINPAALSMLGYDSREEFSQGPLARHLADPERAHQLYQRLLQEKSLTGVRLAIRRKDGSRRIFEGSLRLSETGEHQAASLETLFRDVTEILEAQEAQQARQAAEESNRLKTQFLANMSHEIRTPLNGILGMTHLALEAHPSQRQRGYLEHIQSCGQTLLRVVNDILDFSKVEAGRLELECSEFHLSETIRHLQDMLASSAREKGLQFKIQVDPEVPILLWGDSLRLGQVLVNLVGNAIKFTPQGEVALVIAREATESNSVRLHFEVRDTGIGISESSLKGLFVAFNQADSSTTRKYGGTGLGLALCQRLVHVMGSQLEVRSRLGQGSSFTFSVDFGAGSGSRLREVPPVARDLQSLRGGRVLVVEDNLTNQLIARELLENAGLEVGVANNGQEALDLLSGSGPESHWDVILMDVQMPVMDGCAATAAVRQSEHFGRIPIVAMTAHVLADERHRCQQAGMDDYLSKPIDPELLLTKLCRWLTVKRPNPELAQDFPSIPGVDVQDGLRRVAGNAPLYTRLLLDLIDPQAPWAMELEHAPLDRLQFLAHSLKGQAANLGVTEVAQAAAQVERAAGQGRSEGLPHLLERLQEARANIGSQVHPPAAIEGGATSPDQAHQAVELLRRHLQRSEGEALASLQEVLSLLGPLLAPGRLDRLEKLVRAFEFEAALAELTALDLRAGEPRL